MNEDESLGEEVTFEEEYEDIEQAEAEDQVGDDPTDDPYFDPEVEGTQGLDEEEE